MQIETLRSLTEILHSEESIYQSTPMRHVAFI